LDDRLLYSLLVKEIFGSRLDMSGLVLTEHLYVLERFVSRAVGRFIYLDTALAFVSAGVDQFFGTFIGDFGQLVEVGFVTRLVTFTQVCPALNFIVTTRRF